MARYQVAWKASTKTATVQTYGDTLPSGASRVGNFYESNVLEVEYDNYAGNHVLYHQVRDILYKQGIYDMQRLVIAQDVTYTALSSIAISPGSVSIAVAGTQQLSITPTPGGANPEIASWVSSDPTKATVSATGLVTGVAAGSATITATSVDGAKTATRSVTVTA